MICMAPFYSDPVAVYSSLSNIIGMTRDEIVGYVRMPKMAYKNFISFKFFSILDRGAKVIS
jgi:hypothetical protein